ncbi:hypothetical protein HYALB_00008171 [Hymenoscyphus albidus]|uniref:Allergen n=1 Tax=Hymenoscyphus albidus TaxID=595503 RepID=A0A9N9LZX3_9HELO|nr:hypothetical protein HYALB_00008171 [Hymenoscyphus albidus]
MDNAATAVNKLFGRTTASPTPEVDRATRDSTPRTTNVDDVDVKADVADTTVEGEIKPAVEHTHVKKQHETREQTFVEKEKHQDHYHTTIQPLKDSEIIPEKHDHVQETKHKSINKDDNKAAAKAKADQAGFESTHDEKKFESKTKEPTLQDEHVHHHLHETIQPVIEKEVIVPSVTHKRVVVKEKIQEPAEHHGVTTNSTMSVEDFKNKVDGDKKATLSQSQSRSHSDRAQSTEALPKCKKRKVEVTDEQLQLDCAVDTVNELEN